MQLANQEAQRINRETVGTENLLIGIVKEGSGVAANVLKNLGIDLRKIRDEVDKVVQPGPEMVTMGRLPHTPRMKKVIQASMDAARELGHNYVGSEHLLLGILAVGEGIAAQILTNLGATSLKVKEEIGLLLNHERKVNEPKVVSPALLADLKQARDSINRAIYILSGEQPMVTWSLPSVWVDKLPEEKQ